MRCAVSSSSMSPARGWLRAQTTAWPRRLSLTTAMLILVSGCGKIQSSADVTVIHPRRTLTSSPASLAFNTASTLLADIRLPSGAVRLPRPPSSARELLDQPPPSEPRAHVVDQHAFWLSPTPPARLLAFLITHAPQAAQLIHTGSLQRHGRTYYWSEELEVPSGTSAAVPQRISFAVVPDASHRFAIRVDARVGWHQARPDDSLVSGSIDSVTVTVARPTRPYGHTMGSRLTPPLTLTNTASIKALASSINGLPLAEVAGAPASCPPQDGRLYAWLTFIGPHPPARTLVQADPYGCGQETAWITTFPGHPIALTGSTELIRLVEKLIGSRLKGLPNGS